MPVSHFIWEQGKWILLIDPINIYNVLLLFLIFFIMFIYLKCKVSNCLLNIRFY